MKNRIFTSLLLLVGMAFFAPSVSAEIFLGQPDSLYNLGDEIAINVTIIPKDTTNDFLTAKISCGAGEVDIYKSPYYINAADKKNLAITAKLDRYLIGSLGGECIITAIYSDSRAESQKFEITNKVNVFLDFDSGIVEPGKEIKISGTAKKSNGKMLNGFVEISVPVINAVVSSPVYSGHFNTSILIPQNAPSGSYEINAGAYEKDSSGVISNEGNATSYVRIKQIIERVDIAFNAQSIVPGNEISYTILLYDQSGAEARQDATAVIHMPDRSIFMKKIVKSGEANTLKIELNHSPGYWGVEGILGNLNGKREFYVEELQIASFNLENQTLKIKNIGNIRYKKPVEISFGERSEVKEVDIGIGETKKYKLLAPDGSYPISISEGNSSMALGVSYLTGNSIGVKDFDSLSLGNKFAVVVWIVIILILAFIVVVYYRKVRKKKYTGKSPVFESRKIRDLSNMKNAEIPVVSRSYSPPSGPSGKKEETIVIALKIKNMRELLVSEGNAYSPIDKALQKAKEAGARTYEQGEYKIIILPYTLTKENDNAMSGIILANEIESILKEHNKKYAHKIRYGIGINIGEMIVENLDGKIKFTSVGTVTVNAKSAAEKADGEILLSGPLHRKVAGKVKTEPVLGREFWKVKSFIERNQHSDFIKKFMKRQK